MKVLWFGSLGMGTSFCRVTEAMVTCLVRDLGHEVTVVSELANTNKFRYDDFETSFSGDLSMTKGRRYDVLVFLGSTDDAIAVKDVIDRVDAGKRCCYCPVEFKKMKCKGLDHFDAVFTMTEFGKSVIGLPGKTHVIPHGVSSESFFRVPRSECRETCRRLGFNIRPGDFVIFNGNRNEYRKRVDLTIEVFKKLRARFPEGRLKLLLHSASGSLAGFDPDIIVTDPRTKRHPHFTTKMLNTIYGACDVGINTSIGEGWGLVAHEMAALGVPQVVPHFASYPELYGGRRGHATVPVTEKAVGWCGQGEDHMYEAFGGVIDVDVCVDRLADVYTNYTKYFLGAHIESDFFKSLTYEHATKKMFDLI